MLTFHTGKHNVTYEKTCQYLYETRSSTGSTGLGCQRQLRQVSCPLHIGWDYTLDFKKVAQQEGILEPITNKGGKPWRDVQEHAAWTFISREGMAETA
jgi:hypothetical protein